MSTLRVQDVMTPNPASIRADDRPTFKELIDKFKQFHHLPVVDERDRLVGMITSVDVLRAAVEFHQRFELSQVTSRPVATVGAWEPLVVAARRMTEGQVHSLPVVGTLGELVGIVTSTDLMHALSVTPQLPAEIDEQPIDRLMTRDPVTIAYDATVGDAAAALAEAGVRHLPVIDSDRRVVGIVSEADLRAELGTDVARFASAESTRLDEPLDSVFTANPTVIRSGTPLRDAFDAFADERLTALPVVDDRDCIVGMLSYVDVLRWLKQLTAEKPAAREAVYSVEGP